MQARSTGDPRVAVGAGARGAAAASARCGLALRARASGDVLPLLRTSSGAVVFRSSGDARLGSGVARNAPTSAPGPGPPGPFPVRGAHPPGAGATGASPGSG